MSNLRRKHQDYGGIFLYANLHIIQSYAFVTEETANGFGDDSEVGYLGLIIVAGIVTEYVGSD